MPDVGSSQVTVVWQKVGETYTDMQIASPVVGDETMAGSYTV